MTKTTKKRAEDLPALFSRCWSGTLEELAAAAGCSLGSAWNWSRGVRSPNPAAMSDLARVLGCTLEELQAAATLSEDERRGRRADSVLLLEASRLLRRLASPRGKTTSELRAAALLLARECRAAGGAS